MPPASTLGPSLITLPGSFLSDQDRAYTSTAARPSPHAGHSPTPQRFVRCCSLSLVHAQWPHSGVDGAPCESRGAAGPIRFSSAPPGPVISHSNRAWETRAVSASLTPIGLCPLGRGPSRAPSPRQVPRGSTPRLTGPGAAAVARGPPTLFPERPATSRKAAASRKRRGHKPPLAPGGPPPSLAHLGPRQRLGRASNPSAIQRSCSDEEWPGLARSTGFLPPAPPELRN
ncbi:hypothetical protein NDU88_002372 [Pleurodeles waltl]|uniref:Uncharacterized protein n=1 Tax=Pleurodeles waltl TaxID=8319 RepID=A0AAV7UAY2_PLEWA|nr:hypothetical protein NDU88_002372 [Pleurodeles waltl]